MGGAQPLAVTMNGGVALCVDVDPCRDRAPPAHPLPGRGRRGPRRRRPRAASRPRRAAGRCSVGLVGNAADVLPDLLRRGFEVDIVTDQTTRARPAHGYVPDGMTLEQALRDCAAPIPRSTSTRPRARRWPQHCRGDGRLHGRAARRSSTTATSLRAEAQLGGFERAFDYPGLRARLHPAAVLRGQGAVPLGGAVGRPGRHRTPPTGRCSRCSPTTSRSCAGCTRRQERVAFQGLPARICWLGYGERDPARVALQRAGRLAASCPRRS